MMVTVKEIVLTALGFSVGVAAVSAVYHARYHEWFYVMARAGFAVAFGLLLEAVSKAPVIPGSWRTWVFIAACLMTGVGYLGVVREDHTKRTRGRYL